MPCRVLASKRARHAVTAIAAAFVFVCHAQGADDSQICDHVEKELARDPWIQAADVEATCLRGVVTLEGTADNLLAKERALRQAEAVRGVKSVVNMIDVRPSRRRKDAAIENDVSAALLSNPATDSFEVEVRVDAGDVTLTGTVDSWREKQLSGQVAKGVAGVTSLNNQLIIKIRDNRPDEELESEIRQAIKRDVFLNGAADINVSVEDGMAVLTGTVGSAFQRRRATELASTYAVSEVDTSDLEVDERTGGRQGGTSSEQTLSDSEIENAIQAALLRDPRASAADVDISVNDGYVTLTGVVRNLQARRAAEQDARNTSGVVYVKNRLKVSPESPPSDMAIQQKIEDGLLRNPQTDESDITVAVFNGVANLFGAVETQLEKDVAEDVAATVKGVRVVDNNLEVIDRGASTLYNPYLYDPYVDGYQASPPVYVYNPLPGRKAIADEGLEQRIEEEIRWSPIVDANQVFVRVYNGEATLTGIVDSWAESQAAAENALEAGARYVVNNLVIR